MPPAGACSSIMNAALNAQAKFLHDHLGRWIESFARSVALNGVEPYLTLAHVAALSPGPCPVAGHRTATVRLDELQRTFDSDFSCSACALAGGEHFTAQAHPTTQGVQMMTAILLHGRSWWRRLTRSTFWLPGVVLLALLLTWLAPLVSSRASPWWPLTWPAICR